MSSTVYVANSCGQNVYVLVSKTSGWKITDLLANGASLVTGFGEIRAGLVIADNLPAVISTVADLYQALKAAALIASGEITLENSVKSLATSAAQAIISLFKQSSIQITPSNFTDVSNVSGLKWLNPSSIGGLLGASTLNLTIVTEDGKHTANFDTNQDYSWIATNSGVVRAQYGHLWVQDPGSGSYAFS